MMVDGNSKAPAIRRVNHGSSFYNKKYRFFIIKKKVDHDQYMLI
jgi:hypothetical protein